VKQGGLRLIVLGALILAALWAGVRVYSISHPSSVVGERVPVGSASPPTLSDLTPAELAAPAIKIPEHLPMFSLNDLSGALKSSKAWSGKPLVLNFWATWCAPCRREIPLLKALSAEWAAQQLTVIGIAVDQPEKVRQFVDDFKIGYPMLVGEQDALDLASQLGVAAPAFPFSVFVDGSGEVVTLFVGELHRPQATLILSVVQSLDAHALDLAHARQKIAAGLDQLASAGASG
jgi:thiol-disulfide isomerase/thioredoxin